MAKILISYFSSYGESTYDAITNGFLEQGNDVLRINWLNILKYKKSWGETSLQDDKIRQKINFFNPDIVMDYNHSLPIEFTEKFNCPICILDADNPEAFWNKEYLNNNYKRYKYLGGGACSEAWFKKLCKNDMEKDQYMDMPTATVMKKQDLPYKRNIFFIGANWFCGFARKNTVEEYDILEFLYEKYKETFMFDKVKVKKELLDKGFKEDYIDNYCNDDFKWHMAGQERMKDLSVLTDLGLETYGTNWKTVSLIDFELAKNSIEGVISDTNKVNELYNSSKISVNISHPQSINGFSWRVWDIMASNSCLLVERKEQFENVLGKYLSKEVKEAIIYDDRFDMRAKAINLLNNEELRLKCVKECNEAIEQNGRWHHRLQSLEDFLGIKILNNKNINQYYEFIKKEVNRTNKRPSKIKIKLALFLYSVMFSLSLLPITNKVFKKHKLLKKITTKMGQL